MNEWCEARKGGVAKQRRRSIAHIINMMIWLKTQVWGQQGNGFSGENKGTVAGDNRGTVSLGKIRERSLGTIGERFLCGK